MFPNHVYVELSDVCAVCHMDKRTHDGLDHVLCQGRADMKPAAPHFVSPSVSQNPDSRLQEQHILYCPGKSCLTVCERLFSKSERSQCRCGEDFATNMNYCSVRDRIEGRSDSAVSACS